MNPHSSAELEHFFELTHDLLCIVGDDGYFKRVNPAVPALLGYSLDEILAAPVSTFIHPEDRQLTALYRKELHQGKPLLQFENRYLTKKGDVVWLSWTSVYVTASKLVYAIAKDITHTKRLDETRNSLLTSFTKINSELKQLSYTTAHDLRAPVNNLLAVFQMIDTSKIVDPETLEFIEILRSATESLKSTLNAYVDVLSTKDRLSVVVAECSLEEAVANVMLSIRILVQYSEVDLTVDFSAAPHIRFNKTYLESVFLNLITNSIKYKKPDVAPKLRIVSTPSDQGVNVVYSDNGLGFDMATMRGKLFGFRETFHQNIDSKGIGMYLIHSHITSLGGRIDVESELGQGSNFTMTFRN